MVNYSKIKRRNGVVKRPLPAPEELPLIINFRLNLSISLDSRIEGNSQAEVMFKGSPPVLIFDGNFRFSW